MKRRGGVHGLRLVLAAALAGGALTGAITYRSHQAASERARQQAAIEIDCQRLHKLVTVIEAVVQGSASKQALLKSAYYREHPGEIKRAQEGARRTIAAIMRADCQPSRLPTVKGP